MVCLVDLGSVSNKISVIEVGWLVFPVVQHDFFFIWNEPMSCYKLRVAAESWRHKDAKLLLLCQTAEKPSAQYYSHALIGFVEKLQPSVDLLCITSETKERLKKSTHWPPWRVTADLFMSFTLFIEEKKLWVIPGNMFIQTLIPLWCHYLEDIFQLVVLAILWVNSCHTPPSCAVKKRQIFHQRSNQKSYSLGIFWPKWSWLKRSNCFPALWWWNRCMHNNNRVMNNILLHWVILLDYLHWFISLHYFRITFLAVLVFTELMMMFILTHPNPVFNVSHNYQHLPDTKLYF